MWLGQDVTVLLNRSELVSESCRFYSRHMAKEPATKLELLNRASGGMCFLMK